MGAFFEGAFLSDVFLSDVFLVDVIAPALGVEGRLYRHSDGLCLWRNQVTNTGTANRLILLNHQDSAQST